MKVLFVVPYVPSLIRVRPYHFVRELTRQGHAVTVLAASIGPSEADADALRSVAERVEVVRVRGTESMGSCLIAALRGQPLQAAVSVTPALRRRLRDLLAEQAFDVVHIEHLRAARLVHDLPGTLPRLYDAVDSISLLLERTLRSSHSLRQRAIAVAELQRTRAFEGRVISAFDEAIVTSSDDAEILARLAPGAALEVVPNGVDQDYFRPLPASSPRQAGSLVFSGKMSYHANVTAILHFVRTIWPLVRAQRPDARLTIVGSSPTAAVRDLARDPSITVTGEVSDLRPYVGSAAVAVCPMVVKVGIQNKLLEAMAMETPTVATRIGAMGLAAQPGSDFLVADSDDEFARHVVALLGDEDRARQIGRAGRRYVEQQHSWDAATRRLVELYARAAVKRTDGPRARLSPRHS